MYIFFCEFFLKIPNGMANNVDPDQTAPEQEQSDLGLHCLHMPLCQTLWCRKFKDIYCMTMSSLLSYCCIWWLVLSGIVISHVWHCYHLAACFAFRWLVMYVS